MSSDLYTLNLPLDLRWAILDFLEFEVEIESLLGVIHERISQTHDAKILNYLSQLYAYGIEHNWDFHIHTENSNDKRRKFFGQRKSAPQTMLPAGATSLMIRQSPNDPRLFHKMTLYNSFKNKHFYATQVKLFYGYFREDTKRQIFLVFPNLTYLFIEHNSRLKELMFSPLCLMRFEMFVPWNHCRRLVLSAIPYSDLLWSSNKSVTSPMASTLPAGQVALEQNELLRQVFAPSDSAIFRFLPLCEQLETLYISGDSISNFAWKEMCTVIKAKAAKGKRTVQLRTLYFSHHLKHVTKDTIREVLSVFPTITSFGWNQSNEEIATGNGMHLVDGEIAKQHFGRLKRLHCTVTHAAYLQVLEHCTELYRLSILLNGTTGCWKALECLPSLVKLTHLAVDSTSSSTGPAGDMIAKLACLCPNIRVVSLQRVNLTDKGLEMLIRTPMITSLDCSRNASLNSDGFVSLLQNTTLTNLRLDEVSLHDGIGYIASCSSITHLHMDSCNMQQLERIHRLMPIEAVNSITTISLARTPGFTYEAIRLLSVSLPRLTDLNLSYCYLTDNVACALFESSGLMLVNLAANALTSAVFPAIQNCRTLRWLNLSKNPYIQYTYLCELHSSCAWLTKIVFQDLPVQLAIVSYY